MTAIKLLEGELFNEVLRIPEISCFYPNPGKSTLPVKCLSEVPKSLLWLTLEGPHDTVLRFFVLALSASADVLPSSYSRLNHDEKYRCPPLCTGVISIP